MPAGDAGRRPEDRQSTDESTGSAEAQRVERSRRRLGRTSRRGEAAGSLAVPASTLHTSARRDARPLVTTVHASIAEDFAVPADEVEDVIRVATRTSAVASA